MTMAAGSVYSFHQPISRMDFRFTENFRFFAAIALSALLAGGCGRHSTAHNSTGMSPASASDAVAPPPRVQPVTVTETDSSAVLAQLTGLVRRYAMERRKAPQSLDEIVTAGYLSGLPPAPSGKKFVINPKTLQVSLASK
jgi:hypothetical protein